MLYDCAFAAASHDNCTFLLLVVAIKLVGGSQVELLPIVNEIVLPLFVISVIFRLLSKLPLVRNGLGLVEKLNSVLETLELKWAVLRLPLTVVVPLGLKM